MTSLLNATRHTRHMPVAIRSGAFRIDTDLRDTIAQLVRRAFRRYARRISKVRAWLDDQNGPRGGVDRTCRVQVQLTAAGTATVESRAHTVYAALAVALERAKKTIDRTLKRRRTRARFAKWPHSRHDGRNGRGRLSICSGPSDSVPESIVEDAE